MKDARGEILGRIRRRRGAGGGAPSAAEREDLRAYLAAHPRGPVPELEGELLARFQAKAVANSASVERVAQSAQAPAAVARFLKEKSLPLSGAVWPALAALDWRGADLELEARAANGEDAVGVTGVFCALAETGTLMLVSGADTPSSVSLLPETHVALVPAARVLARMEDAWDLLRAERGGLPRAVNFVSGPSRTADIEQTLILGAHGPSRVHIVLVG